MVSTIDNTGHTVQEIFGRDITMLAPPDRNDEMQKIRNTVVSGQCINHFETIRVRKDGVLIHVSLVDSPILNTAREIIGISSIARDITEQKRSEEVLRINQFQLSQAMDLAQVAHWELDPVSHTYIFNDPFYVLYGTTAEQEGGYQMTREEYVKRFVHPDDLPIFEQAVKENIVTTQPEVLPYLEHRIIRRDGDVRHILVRASVVTDNSGHILKRYGVNQDITDRQRMEESLRQTMEKLRKSLVGTIKTLSTTLETRDPYTSGHQERVSRLALEIAQEMALSTDIADNIRMAATIHDIGKISVPTEILSKPGKLTNAEFSLIKRHSQLGYDMLKDAELPYPVAEIILQHHERLDGLGYPQGLKGDEILLEAQIICIADVVEAMASHRPYRPALGIDKALEEIEKNQKVLYNVDATRACLRLFREKGFKFA